jgi:hypothetical protein
MMMGDSESTVIESTSLFFTWKLVDGDSKGSLDSNLGQVGMFTIVSNSVVKNIVTRVDCPRAF